MSFKLFCYFWRSGGNEVLQSPSKTVCEAFKRRILLPSSACWVLAVFPPSLSGLTPFV